MGRCATKMVMLGDFARDFPRKCCGCNGGLDPNLEPQKTMEPTDNNSSSLFLLKLQFWGIPHNGQHFVCMKPWFYPCKIMSSCRFLCELSWWLGVPKLLKWPRHHVEQHESLGFIELLRQEASGESLWRTNPCCNGAVARWFCMSFCLKKLSFFLEFSSRISSAKTREKILHCWGILIILISYTCRAQLPRHSNRAAFPATGHHRWWNSRLSRSLRLGEWLENGRSLGFWKSNKKKNYMGLSIVMGIPPNGWFTKENPSINGWWFGGTTILGNLHMTIII